MSPPGKPSRTPVTGDVPGPTVTADLSEPATPVAVAPKQAPKVGEASAPPRATTSDPWKNLHPGRVWPD